MNANGHKSNLIFEPAVSPAAAPARRSGAALPAAYAAPRSRQAWALAIAIIGLLIFFALAMFFAIRGRRIEAQLRDARAEIQRLNDYSTQQQQSYEKLLDRADALAQWKFAAAAEIEMSLGSLESCGQDLLLTAQRLKACSRRLGR